MFTKKIILSILFVALIATGMVACKKDAFSEKDAIAAQTALLQTKYENERSLEQLRQQGATALAQLNHQLALQASSRTALQMDSINRAYKRFIDSMAIVTGRIADSIAISNSKKIDITVFVRDQVTAQPIAAATVLLPTTIGTVLTATTDATGAATFPAANNINVANTVQAIVSKVGYTTSVSGFITRAITATGTVAAGATTVSLWNIGNLRNTVSGRVTIEANLNNESVENVAGQLITIYNTFNGNRNFFTGITNAAGNYSISLPDAVAPFFFLETTKDTTTTLMVNSLLPGTDSIPSVVSVPSTFGLQQFNANTAGNGSRPTTPAGSVPTGNINRFYASVNTPDSLGRRFYFKNLNVSSTQEQLTQETNLMFTSNFLAFPASTYDANGNIQTFNVSARYPSTVVAQTGITNLGVRFVDLLNNNDNLFLRMPSLQAGASWTLTTPPTAGYGVLVGQSLPSTPISAPGVTSVYTLYPTRSTATGNLNGYDRSALAQVRPGILTYTTIRINKSYVNNSGFLPAVPNLIGGASVTINLTFGAGALSQGVR